jgi:hypothetical protein
MASTGQASTQASQSMYSLGIDVELRSPFRSPARRAGVDAVDRAELNHDASLVAMEGSLTTSSAFLQGFSHSDWEITIPPYLPTLRVQNFSCDGPAHTA